MIKRAIKEDIEFLNMLWHHPEIAPYIKDDLSEEKRMNFESILSIPNLYFLIPYDENQTKAGCFFVQPWNSICFEVHTLILPEFRGPIAVRFGKEAVEWGFQNTPCRKIVTQVPLWNIKAYAFAKKVGFRIEGKNKESFLKGGRLYDQYIMGIKKEEN